MNLNELKLFLRTLSLSLILIGVSLSLFAQRVNISYSNTQIKTILKEIGRQSGYTFVYSDALKGVDNRISITYASDNVNLTQLLTKVFQGTGITFTISDKQIALLNKAIKAGNSPLKLVVL